MESKQQPGTAEPGNMLGCCLNYFHFLWAILSTSTVHLCLMYQRYQLTGNRKLSRQLCHFNTLPNYVYVAETTTQTINLYHDSTSECTQPWQL